MRRIVMLCLVLLLPVQWTWAAAAAYCTHETSSTAQHLGHHEHKHRADTSGKTSASKLVVDDDCTLCHLSGLQWVDMGMAPLLAVDLAPPSIESGVVFSSHIPIGPERPDRSRIA